MYLEKRDNRITIMDTFINKKKVVLLLSTEHEILENLKSERPNYIVEKINSCFIPITEVDDKLRKFTPHGEFL